MKKIALLLGGFAFLLAAGCRSVAEPAVPVLDITGRSVPIVTDGRLTEPVWLEAPACPLALLDSCQNLPERTREVVKSDPFERGAARFLYDGEYLYIGIDFDDSDIVAQRAADQTALYSSGDVAEVFLKPVNARWYWELFVSPLGNKSSFLFPGGGHAGLPAAFRTKLMPDLKAAAAVDGTVNRSGNTDRGWTAEIAIPCSELEKPGVPFSPDASWTVLVARYNYSVGLRARQYSSCPSLPQVSYHLTEYYLPFRAIRRE